MKQGIEKGGFVLCCNKQAEIESVLLSDIPFDFNTILHQSFASLALPDSQDPMLHFIEALKQFGTADGWHLHIQLNGQPYYMTFNGVCMERRMILVANKYVDPADSGNGQKKAVNTGFSSEVSMYDDNTFTAEMDENELLEELSRLNNELINNKRELIRQNIELERLKKQD